MAKTVGEWCVRAIKPRKCTLYAPFGVGEGES